MKRLSGVVVLLAGLSGCISFNAPPRGEKKSSARKPLPTMSLPGDLALSSPPPLSLPGPASAAAGTTVWAPPSENVPLPAVPAGGPVAGVPTPPATYSQPAPAAVATNPAPAPASTPADSALPVPGGAGVTAAAALAPNTLPPLPATNLNRAVEPGAPATKDEPPGVIRQTSAVETAGATETKAEPLKPLPPPPVLPAALGGKEPVSVDPKGGKQGSPLVRLVNTKRITMNFEVKDVGPSGLAAVDLWYTQDGKEWKKYEAPTQAEAYVVEVDEEGMYGFTLVARSGQGLGGDPPVSGDQPQVWVIVDLSRPEVQLGEVTPKLAGKERSVTVHWTASDKNLGRNPITLSYAEKEDGPWKVIASNLENSGKYVWNLTNAPPAQFHVKVEATDLAGNVGVARSKKPVPLDNSRPQVSITNVLSTPEK